MNEILCIQCGEVALPVADKCPHCGSAEIVPADSPIARKFIDERAARKQSGGAQRAAATGKVLGRALGRFLKK